MVTRRAGSNASRHGEFAKSIGGAGKQVADEAVGAGSWMLLGCPILAFGLGVWQVKRKVRGNPRLPDRFYRQHPCDA